MTDTEEEMAPSFAVIIPVFNGRDHVLDAVASALDQPHLAQVVVVDDGSSDGSADLVRRLGDPRVEVLEQENAGPGAARNAGAAVATARFLVFLDADDRLLPGALEVFAALHASGSEVARTGAVSRSAPGADQILPAMPHPLPFPRGCPLAGSFSVSKSLFDAIGGYDVELRFGENTELLMRLHQTAEGRGADTAFGEVPTVLRMVLGERSDDRYDISRLKAIERMLSIHEAELREDRETLASHLAIASRLERKAGRWGRSIHHAQRCARADPRNPRAWGRLLRSLLPVA